MLFRYFSSHVVETLRDSRLLASKISGFNDPFEFLFSPQREHSPDELKKVIENRLANPSFLLRFQKAFPGKTIDEARVILNSPGTLNRMQDGMPQVADSILALRTGMCDNRIRMICFSAVAEPFHEILMWSHYANSHRGWRLGFELPDDPLLRYKTEPVDYSEDRVPIRSSGASDDPELELGLQQALLTKCSAWSYEAEHRLIAKLACLEYETLPTGDEIHFLPFSKDSLIKVDLGLKSDLNTNSEIINLIRASYPHVEINQARFHPTEFRVMYEPIP